MRPEFAFSRFIKQQNAILLHYNMFWDPSEIYFVSWMKAEIVRKTTLSHTCSRFNIQHWIEPVHHISAFNCMHIYVVKWGVYNWNIYINDWYSHWHLTVSERQRSHNVYVWFVDLSSFHVKSRKWSIFVLWMRSSFSYLPACWHLVRYVNVSCQRVRKHVYTVHWTADLTKHAACRRIYIALTKF